MIGMVELAEDPDGSPWIVVRSSRSRWRSGSRSASPAGCCSRWLRRFSFPSPGLYTLRMLAGAGVIYGVAAVAGGSGFLAVFVAGLLVGDVRAPFKAESEVFHEALSSLAEIVVFVALGLTISISSTRRRHLARRAAARRGAGVRDPARRRLAAAAAGPAAARRAGIRRLGRPQGRGADPARRVRARRTSTTPSGSTTSSSWSCSRRCSCRARRSRSPRAASACRCAGSTPRRRPRRRPRSRRRTSNCDRPERPVARGDPATRECPERAGPRDRPRSVPSSTARVGRRPAAL